MKGPLEVRAEGLPDGAHAEFVANKDPKKATVRIRGIETAFSGAVRLYLKAADQPERIVNLADPNVLLALASRESMKPQCASRADVNRRS